MTASLSQGRPAAVLAAISAPPGVGSHMAVRAALKDLHPFHRFTLKHRPFAIDRHTARDGSDSMRHSRKSTDDHKLNALTGESSQDAFKIGHAKPPLPCGGKGPLTTRRGVPGSARLAFWPD